jgi:hypothetical protein
VSWFRILPASPGNAAILRECHCARVRSPRSHERCPFGDFGWSEKVKAAATAAYAGETVMLTVRMKLWPERPSCSEVKGGALEHFDRSSVPFIRNARMISPLDTVVNGIIAPFFCFAVLRISFLPIQI